MASATKTHSMVSQRSDPHPLLLTPPVPTAKTQQTCHQTGAKFGVPTRASALSPAFGLFHRFFSFMGISSSELVSWVLYSFACGVRGCASGGIVWFFTLSCNFSYLVFLFYSFLPYWLGDGYLKVGRRVLSFTAKVT